MAEISPYVTEWARLLAAGDYFMSHETLEEHWAEAPEEDRLMLQALIHLAVGFLHHTKGNVKGAGLQFSKALKRLDGYPDAHLGVDVAKARAFLVDVERKLREGEVLEPPALLIG